MKEKKKQQEHQESLVEIQENILVIHVSQELDHHIANRIREAADACIIENKIRNIIFDFTGTVFMDSSGIGVIMGRYKLIRDYGGKIVVLHPGRNIQKILLYSGLNKITKQFEKAEEAIAYLREEC